MKKTLLVLILFCSQLALQAQNFNAPSQFNNVCDTNFDGFASFYMMEITSEIMGNNNPNNYTVTHHLSYSDADTNANPLPQFSYTNIANPQTLFVRIVKNATGEVTIMSYNLTVNLPILVHTMNYGVCDTDEDGITSIDIWALSNAFWQDHSQGPNTMQLSFHLTQQDAQFNTNPIIGVFNNTTPYQQTIYVRAVSTQSGCVSLADFNLFINYCAPICEAPNAITVTSATINSATVSWAPFPLSNLTEIFVTTDAAPEPTENTVVTMISEMNSVIITGLTCDTGYKVYLRTVCSPDSRSGWAGPYFFNTMYCVGANPPVSLTVCSDEPTVCFNLSQNDAIVLGGLNPAEHQITYHSLYADALTGANALTQPSNYCTAAPEQEMYLRIEHLPTNQFQVFTFFLQINSVYPNAVQLSNLSQCDESNTGSVTFSASQISSQINGTDTLTYYLTNADALAEINPIDNPQVFTVATGNTRTIFIRRELIGDCDLIYKISLMATANCNVSATCVNANSLCHALGMPFANSQGLDISEPGTDYGCLTTHPNPTWFFLPVTANGTINLKIEQNTSIDFTGNPQDVDYIVYGPFDNPVSSCAALTSPTIVSCSYSPDAVEYPVIAGAQTGEFYLIMTTNYSNSVGFIRITETSNTQGQIGCSGMRLNAFLDTNANGTQDNGEANFPYGEFHYWKNNEGAVHHISSPSGVYNLYDDNATNSYDLSFTVDAAYGSYYTVTTASYTNVTISEGMTTYNFPVTVAQPYQDLAVDVISMDAPRAGFTHVNKVIYSNRGNQTVATGTLTFTNDPALTITGSPQAGVTLTATGFTYTFSNLLPFETREMLVTLQVPPIPTVVLGQNVTNEAAILPLAGDAIPSNNNYEITETIIGSYDPNDKMEAHGSEILVSDFTTDDYLYYTIRFENTGTASAVNIRVSDILDAQLDEATVKMVDASHDYILDRVDNTLTWKLDNVQLPPSVAGTETGKGYLNFKVKPRTVVAGDIIPNTAAIYFDFNPAIITNTFETHFVNFLKTTTFEKDQFSVYPNPASDIVNVKLESNSGLIKTISVTDVTGKIVWSQKNIETASQTINVKGFSSGIYFVEVTATSNAKSVKKLIVK